ncbi:MAG: endonuclease/exonuclease/phosphatase family protein [Gemmatimonadota bacterium]
MRRLTAAFVALIACTATAGCATGFNYTHPLEPRHASDSAAASQTALAADTLRVVSFNIAYARHVDRAIELLTSESTLRDADVILLQEMDEDGTRRIAEAVDAEFIYYAAVRASRTGRDFGNAVLSRWPIVEDAKLILPHRAFLRHTQRIATAATIRFGSTLVRVYSVHLGTVIEIGGGARRDQLDAILDDAERYTHVAIGGDMNSHGVGALAAERGFAWPTRDGPRTTLIGRLDHIFLKGLVSPDSLASGTVLDVRDASDHRPVWTVALIPQTRIPPEQQAGEHDEDDHCCTASRPVRQPARCGAGGRTADQPRRSSRRAHRAAESGRADGGGYGDDVGNPGPAGHGQAPP